MALVDYTSSSDSESSSPPAKKRKQPPSSALKPSPSQSAKPASSQLVPPLRPSRPSSPRSGPPQPPSSTSQPSSPSPSKRPRQPPPPSTSQRPPSSHPQPHTSSSLPPLPSTFHDLYAHTVRHCSHDIPSQHQNRRRTIPHVAGNWPSHVYIEWRPSASQHALLGSFLSVLQSRLSSSSSSSNVELHQFLTSDLGAPLPLHVSLSRPFVLTTGEKDEFSERIMGEIERSKVEDSGRGRGWGMGRFRLSCAGGVEWHRTGESGRSFLVLRVRSVTCRDQSANGTGEGGGENQTGENGREEENDEAAGREKDVGGKTNRNPELTTLLARCNKTVASYGQPELYAWATDGVTEGKGGVGDAFHVSIAWSFAEPDEEVRRVTEEVFAETRFGEGIRGMEFEVDGVKVKIGNVVCHVPLGKEGGKRKGIFGI